MANQTTNSSADVVGVFDSKFSQLFPIARPLKASVREEATTMDHPVESSATVTDHRIIDPVEIEFTLMVAGEQYRDTFATIRQAFLKGDLLTVQTKAATYSNMILAGIPHEEHADLGDAVPVYMRLKEVILVTAQFQALPPSKVASSKDASTVKRGQQTGKNEGTGGDGKQKSSILYGVFYGS